MMMKVVITVKNHVLIGDFVKLTGSTLKTIIYYHKIGLLQEPERSPGGYRLYGPAELTRMQSINRLKSLGLDLKRIKEVLGDIQNPKTLREALQSLQVELFNEKKSIEERLTKIELLLNEDTILLNEDINSSPSFQMITEILDTEQIENYAQTCPELFEQQQKLFGILDDFKWGGDYKDTFRALADYFQAHPKQYEISLSFGVRMAKLSQLAEDDPEIEILALESAEYIKSIPQLRTLLCNQPGISKPLESLYNDMVATVISPSRMKFMHLLQKYLNS